MSDKPESDISKLFSDPPTEKFSSPQGTVEVWRPASGIVVTRVAGLLTEGGAASIETAVRRQVALDGRHLGFHDWADMEDYEAGARTRLTTLGVATLRTLEGAHFLLRSRVVAFGVEIANVIVKKLTVHPNRSAFERALWAALRAEERESFTGLPRSATRASVAVR